MKKSKKIQKSILAVFVALFMFMPFVDGTALSASSVPKDIQEQAEQAGVVIPEDEEYNMKESRSLIGAAMALAIPAGKWLLGFFGGYLLSKLVDKGNKKFCKDHKNAKWATKQYCGLVS